MGLLFIQVTSKHTTLPEHDRQLASMRQGRNRIETSSQRSVECSLKYHRIQRYKLLVMCGATLANELHTDFRFTVTFSAKRQLKTPLQPQSKVNHPEKACICSALVVLVRLCARTKAKEDLRTTSTLSIACSPCCCGPKDTEVTTALPL